MSVADVEAQEDRSKGPDQSDEEQLANLSLSYEEDEVKPDEAVDRIWTSRRILKSHLDIVRAVTFAHGPGIMLATGGEDNTVKVWSVDPSTVRTQKLVPRPPRDSCLMMIGLMPWSLSLS